MKTKTTYLLYSSRKSITPLQSMYGARCLLNGPRALLMLEDGEPRPPIDWIRGEETGWPERPQEHVWLRSPLELLHEQYEANLPISGRKQTLAIGAYRRAKGRRDELLRQLEQVKRDEQDAARQIVLTHGNRPVAIDGRTYDPAFAPSTSTIYLIERK